MSRWRVASAVVLTIWLAGWVPAIVYSWRVGGGPQFYAVWIILAPCALSLAAGGAFGLALFYQWAFERPTRGDLQQRIAELEHELNIPSVSRGS